MNPQIILGPPGTGKTSTLLKLVEKELERGTDPARIGFVTFTKRGAEEAAGRACEQFNFTRQDLPFFCTLHSLCFRQLGMQRGDVMEGALLKDFGKYAGVQITGGWRGGDEFGADTLLGGYGQGDRILFLENRARVQGRPLRESYNGFSDDLPWSEVDRVTRSLALYKETKRLHDFTDMLERFVAIGGNIGLDALFVDEAQDLSWLQWRVVALLADGCSRFVVAGDDDQAIYRWAGADADHLIDMAGEVGVLDQSWRVPRNVQTLANGIIGRVRHRRDKRGWRPKEGVDGELRRVPDFQTADLKDGNVLVLARNAYVIRSQVEPELRRQGIIYDINGKSSIDRELLEIIHAWEILRQGGRQSIEVVRRIYKQMKVGSGVTRGFKKLSGRESDERVSIDDLKSAGGLRTDAPWFAAMERLPPADIGYIRTARQRGERIGGETARVRVSTIHGSKGGQAEHVILLREMARRTYDEMQDGGEDDEARVWYVGATRSENRLTIVDSATNREYPWL